jgi:hypothetical protein
MSGSVDTDHRNDNSHDMMTIYEERGAGPTHRQREGEATAAQERERHG